MEWMMQVVSMRRITVAALVIAGAAGAFALAALVGLDLNFFQEEPGIRVKNGSISFTSKDGYDKKNGYWRTNDKMKNHCFNVSVTTTAQNTCATKALNNVTMIRFQDSGGAWHGVGLINKRLQVARKGNWSYDDKTKELKHSDENLKIARVIAFNVEGESLECLMGDTKDNYVDLDSVNAVCEP